MAGDTAARALWRDLAGAGPSHLTLSAATRARDIDRPDAADLAEADRTLPIVRRPLPAEDLSATGPATAGAAPAAVRRSRRDGGRRPS